MKLTIELHKGQLAIYKGFYLDPSKTLGIICVGRQSGKSTVAAYLVILEALKGKRNISYVAPEYSYLLERFKFIHGIFDRYKLVTVSNKSQHVLELKNGSTIRFYSTQGGRVDCCRGNTDHLIILDEASMMEQLEFMVDSAIKPALVVNNGKLLILSTPRGTSNGFVKLFNRAKTENNKETFWYHASSLDNPKINQAKLEEIRKITPPSIFDEEYNAIPRLSTGAVFGDINSIITDQVDDHHIIVYGCDLAQTNDYTSIVGLNKDNVVVRAWNFRGIDWQDIKNKVVSVIGKTRTILDATGVGKAIYDDLKQVCTIIPFVFTNKSKDQIITDLRYGIFNKITRIWKQTPEYDKIVSQLTNYEYNINENGLITYSAPGVEHDDLVCAYALAFYANRQLMGKQSLKVQVGHANRLF